jgi:hypothetical protein
MYIYIYIYVYTYPTGALPKPLEPSSMAVVLGGSSLILEEAEGRGTAGRSRLPLWVEIQVYS